MTAKELSEEQKFYVSEGPVLGSVKDFVSALEKGEISDNAFKFHLDRKDFTNWLDSTLGESDLAKSLSRVKTPKGYLKKLKEFKG